MSLSWLLREVFASQRTQPADTESTKLSADQSHPNQDRFSREKSEKNSPTLPGMKAPMGRTLNVTRKQNDSAAHQRPPDISRLNLALLDVGTCTPLRACLLASWHFNPWSSRIPV